MSSPKPTLNPRIKISKTGRPYVDVADLVKSELERIKTRNESPARPTEPGTNGTNGNNGNGITQNPTQDNPV